MRWTTAFLIGGLLTGCTGDALAPVALQSGTACANCRMTVLDAKLASQIVAPGEEPRFFDDLGCLAAYLRAHAGNHDGGRTYVADHASGAWIPAERAVYSRDPSVATPMDSHLLAYRDDTARTADGAGRQIGRLTLPDVIASAGEGRHDR